MKNLILVVLFLSGCATERPYEAFNDPIYLCKTAPEFMSLKVYAPDADYAAGQTMMMADRMKFKDYVVKCVKTDEQ